MMHVSLRPLVCGILALGAWGCMPSDQSGGSGSGGSKGSGGASASGGSSSSGGSTGSGGASSSGGSSGSGGASSSGGSTASGGSTSSGGSKGSGGSTSSGGSPGSGGSSSSGGSSGSGGSTSACTVKPTVTMSSKIPTVAIVTWTTTQSSPKEAHIDFGLTTTYGMTAPVDLNEKDYRTLLLGMKASKTYHYRVVAKDQAGNECSSPDATLMTGAIANGLAKITVKTMNQSKLAGGFLITGQYVQNAGASGAPAYILDADGEYVWWYAPGGDVTGARMSYDGKYMWMNGANVPSGTTHVRRVSMDGMTMEDFSSQFTGLNHQLTILPDETVAFYAYGSNGCDDIKERSPSGTVKTITNARTAHGGTGQCHVNTIQYSKEDDTLVFSDLDNQDITKVTRSGQVVWILNGTGNQFGANLWKGGNHGVHILGLDHLLVFNNNSTIAAGSTMSIGGTGDGSLALEVKLDLAAKSAKIQWMYKSSIQNDVMGDVERLPNGNTIIGFSTQGVVHEVDASGAVLQELSWPAGASFGYIEKRPTLYGPPPK
jgi:hypothetical protein